MAGKGAGRNPISIIGDSEDAIRVITRIVMMMEGLKRVGAQPDSYRTGIEARLAMSLYADTSAMAEVAARHPELLAAFPEFADSLVSQLEVQLRALNAGYRVCQHCGSRFTARRSDAKTCSSACRQATHRFRKVEQKLMGTDGITADVVYVRLIRAGAPVHVAVGAAMRWLEGRGAKTDNRWPGYGMRSAGL